MSSSVHIALCFHLNAVLGSGCCNNVTVEEVRRLVLDRSIFDYLRLRIGEVFALDYLPADSQLLLNEEWIELANKYDERAVFGIERNGICLLQAWLLEGIRRRSRATIP